MPRNGSGTYTLPAGQPVVTGTVIDSTVHNAFASDVASALTGSLAANGERTASGNLPMGTFKITGLGDATVATDAMNRQAGDARWAQLGAANTITVNYTIGNSSPGWTLDETDAASNERLWRVQAAVGTLYGLTRTDADGAGATWLQVDRTGTTVDSIALNATAITVNGVNVTDFARLSQANTFTAQLTYSSAAPFIRFNETDASATNQTWLVGATGEAFYIGTENDGGGGGVNAVAINRSGTTVDSIALTATAVTVNGVNVNNAAILTTGTLGAVNGSNVTTLNASNISSGTLAAARLPIEVTSGTYTPSLTNVTNVDSSTSAVCHYTRIGNEVTVYGSVAVDPTSNAVLTRVYVTLPVSSNFAAASNGWGHGMHNSSTVSASANTANDVMELLWTSSTTASASLFFSFMYTVI